MMDIPTIALNDAMPEHPLTTEDPAIKNPELLQGFKEINDVDPQDNQVPPAIIIDKEDPNKISIHHEEEPCLQNEECQNVKHEGVENEDDEDEGEEQQQIIIDDSPPCKTPPKSLTLNHAPATTETTTTTAKGALDISPMVSPTSVQRELEEDSDTDDELMRITEANRYIPANTESPQPAQQQRPRSKSLRSQSVSTRRQLLVFADKPTVTKKSDRIIVSNHYGAGPEGALSSDLKPNRRCRSYLVACDFSDESYHAIEWTMGTMMRDGDKLYVVTAVNREDNPEAVKEAGLSLSKELKKASDTVTEEAKKTLGQMLLFDVELITYAICGRVKDILFSLIEELPLTMVVCGSRGRGTVKGLLMGSISTYLVHKSPVPVTVIRPQKKKKAAHKRPVHAVPLSQSVQTGQLAVDEVSKAATTSTSTDKKTSTTTSTTTTTATTDKK
ncbi:hypothetical protein FB192DRAFT_1354558 [Mucor lusitanicus]|uniref:UspA domain-containing protein n=1 Tax=Mucor circinelloides f. lusitanicus TaxID=29924 RepID=A0A8H4F727_MUCCL|nr:hypothetical protein FB192DRAFT_1354558 [Mucor lusitanicus]